MKNENFFHICPCPGVALRCAEEIPEDEAAVGGMVMLIEEAQARTQDPQLRLRLLPSHPLNGE